MDGWLHVCGSDCWQPRVDHGGVGIVLDWKPNQYIAVRWPATSTYEPFGRQRRYYPPQVVVSMKLYLAAAYGRRDEIEGYAAELRDIGHEITSRWHGRQNPHEGSLLADLLNFEGPQIAAAYSAACMDYDDLLRADRVAVFISPRTALMNVIRQQVPVIEADGSNSGQVYRTLAPTGGVLTELGIALAHYREGRDRRTGWLQPDGTPFISRQKPLMPAVIGPRYNVFSALAHSYPDWPAFWRWALREAGPEQERRFSAAVLT